MDFEFIIIKDPVKIVREDVELVKKLNRHYLEYYNKYEDEIKKLLIEPEHKDKKEYVVNIIDRLIKDLKEEWPNAKKKIQTVQNDLFEIFAEHFSKLYVFMQGSTDGIEVDIKEYIKGDMIMFIKSHINSIGKYISYMLGLQNNKKRSAPSSKIVITPKAPMKKTTYQSRIPRTPTSTTKRQKRGGMPPNDKFEMIERVNISEWKILKEETKPSKKLKETKKLTNNHNSKIKDDDHWKIDPDLLKRYYNLSINDSSLDITSENIEKKEVYGFQFGSNINNSLIPVLKVLYEENMRYNHTYDYRDKYWFVLRIIANFIINKNILYYDIETVVDDDQEAIDVLICASVDKADKRFEDVLAPISCKTEKRRINKTDKNAIQNEKGFIERMNSDYDKFIKIGNIEDLTFYENNKNFNKKLEGESTMCSFNLNTNCELSEEMLFNDFYTDDIMCLQEVNINKSTLSKLRTLHSIYIPLFLSENIYPNLKSVLLGKFKKNNSNIIFKDIESFEKFEIIAYYDENKLLIFIKNRLASYEDDEKINKHNVIRINKKEYIDYIKNTNKTNVYIGMTSTTTNNNFAHVVIAARVSDTMIAMNVHLDTDHSKKIMYQELEYIFTDIINVESFFNCDRIFIQGDFNMSGLEIIITLEKNVDNYYASVSDNRKHLNEYHLQILFNNYITKAEIGGKHMASLDNVILLTRYKEDFKDYNPKLEIWGNRGTTTKGTIINLSDHSLIRWSTELPMTKPIRKKNYVINNLFEYKEDSIIFNLKRNKDERIKKMIEILSESDKNNIKPLYEKYKKLPELEKFIRKIIKISKEIKSPNLKSITE